MRFVWRRVIEVAWLALGVAVCVACAVTRDELVGRYQLRYEFGVEVLRLESDGTYEQLFEGPGRAREVNKGRWELRSDREQVVVLHNPMLVADPFGKPRTGPLREPGLALLRIKKRGGTVSLILNEEQALFFDKQ
jgi:hypothetical protein